MTNDSRGNVWSQHGGGPENDFSFGRAFNRTFE
jgi:hypothetical protein